MHIEKDPELIIRLLSNDPKTVNQALTAIYHHNFKQVRKFVLANSGADEDARDIFQEGMMIFYFNLLSKKFGQRSAISTYIFSICRNLWLQRLRKEPGEAIAPEDAVMFPEKTSEVNSSVLTNILKELKEECTQLLTGFYFHDKSIKDLMIEFSLGSEQAAKNKKLRCMEYLIRIIKEKRLSIENFYL